MVGRTLLLSGWLCLMVATGSYAADLSAERLRAVVDAAAAGDMPGIVVHVETRNGEAWSGAAGVTSLDGGDPMTPDKPFRIYSVSKMATAATAFALVDNGTLGLDDPINRWLGPDVIASVPHADSITVRHLIAQTSGIRDYFDDRFVALIREDFGRRWKPAELVELAADGEPAAAPGSAVSYYSNTNFVLLGLIIEAATNGPLADAIRGRVLEPLGMQRTYSWEEPERTTPVAGYFPVDGQLLDVSGVDLSVSWGAGGLISTADDIARLARGLFEGSLLSPESRDLMTSGFRPMAGKVIEYSYGAFLFEPLDPAPIGHSGEGPGFGALVGLVAGNRNRRRRPRQRPG